MRIICLGDRLTVEALSIVGAEPMEVSSSSEFLTRLETLIQNRENIILITKSMVEQVKPQIDALQKKFPGTIVVVVPDVSKDLDMNINRLVSEVVGVSFGN